jgi:hypothetical protein
MKLVQIVTTIPPDLNEGTTKRYEVVASYDTVPDAIDAITAEKHGDGPFDIISVNRQGVRLRAVTEKVLDTGTAYGPKSTTPKPRPAPKPAPKPPAASSKPAAGATAK